MTPRDVEQLLAGFHYDRDIRNLPDNQMFGEFMSGWEDAGSRRQKYPLATLKQLTWGNLGYRVGLHFGKLSLDEIHQIFDAFAQQYRDANHLCSDSHNVPLTSDPEDSFGPETFEFEDELNPAVLEDARERVLLASIAQRQGQAEFRRQLLAAYEGRCPVTGCDAEPALEAAHIIPYQGPDTQHLPNGLLLRADIHSLFDRHFLSIHPDSFEIVLAPELITTCYQELAGQVLALPSNQDAVPDRRALAQHYNCFLEKYADKGL